MRTLQDAFKAQHTAQQTPAKMYSVEGARFQEWALSQVTDKSLSSLIGQLVTAINNNQISELQAHAKFNDALYGKR